MRCWQIIRCAIYQSWGSVISIESLIIMNTDLTWKTHQWMRLKDCCIPIHSNILCAFSWLESVAQNKTPVTAERIRTISFMEKIYNYTCHLCRNYLLDPTSTARPDMTSMKGYVTLNEYIRCETEFCSVAFHSCLHTISICFCSFRYIL